LNNKHKPTLKRMLNYQDLQILKKK